MMERFKRQLLLQDRLDLLARRDQLDRPDQLDLLARRDRPAQEDRLDQLGPLGSTVRYRSGGIG